MDKKAQKVPALVTMNKKQGLLIGIALTLLFTGITLATSTNLSTFSDVEIYAFDQKPAGSDKGNEWFPFTIHPMKVWT